MITPTRAIASTMVASVRRWYSRNSIRLSASAVTFKNFETFKKKRKVN